MTDRRSPNADRRIADSDCRVSEPDAHAEAPHRLADCDHVVYVLRCADGTYYTGYTTDVERRVREHDAGEAAKYTRGRTPVALVHVEGFDTRSTAMSREYELKELSRAAKERLVGDGGVPASLDVPDDLVAEDA